MNSRLCTYYAAYRDFHGKPPPLMLKNISQLYNRVALAFFVLDKNSTITSNFLEKYISEEKLKADAAFLRKEYGMKVLASLIDSPENGWNTCNDDIFVKNLQVLVKDWDLQGLDWDGDGAYYTDKYKTLIPKARKVLGKDMFFSIVLYHGAGDLPLLRIIKDDIDAVATMAYSDDINTPIQLMETYAEVIPKEKIFAGIKINVASLETVTKLAEYIREHGYGGIMIWSADMDIKDFTGKEDGIYAKTAQKGLLTKGQCFDKHITQSSYCKIS